jgi:methylmalonyl-CoA mutase C-terminal domain/subunit
MLFLVEKRRCKCLAPPCRIPIRDSEKGKKMTEKPIRVLIAKPGLDGHDRGAKVVAHALREAGMEAIYTGLHQTVEQIVEAALQEDVDAIGLSILSGAHLPITEKMMELLAEQDMADVLVVVGGNIPQRDIEKLKALGVAGVFPTATSFEDIVRFIKEKVGGGQ